MRYTFVKEICDEVIDIVNEFYGEAITPQMLKTIEGKIHAYLCQCAAKGKIDGFKWAEDNKIEAITLTGLAERLPSHKELIAVTTNPRDIIVMFPNWFEDWIREGILYMNGIDPNNAK